MSHRVVVDASVVRAAGETDHPVSSASRACLETIRRICHHVVITPAIRKEWDRHMSRFSRKWKVSMAARRKLQSKVVPAPLQLRWDRYSNGAREAIEKDCCILEAALAADHVVVTLDEALRQALSEQRDGQAVFRSLCWINPVTDGVGALAAL